MRYFSEKLHKKLWILQRSPLKLTRFFSLKSNQKHVNLMSITKKIYDRPYRLTQLIEANIRERYNLHRNCLVDNFQKSNPF